MKRIFVLLIFGVFIFPLLKAQDEYASIPAGKARVIALGGLSARAAPYQTSLRLGTAPFGSIVDVIDGDKVECREGILSDVSMFLGFEENGEASTFSRNGCWVKVKYGNQTAYMLDSYLLSVEFEDSDKEEEVDLTEDPEYQKPVYDFSKDYYLGFQGLNCVTNLPPSDRLNWYGVFQSSATESAALEAITLSFTYHRTEIPSQITYAEPSKNLKMIIGSKKQMKAFSPITYFAQENHEFYIRENDRYYQNEELAQKYGLRLALADDENQDSWLPRPLTLTRNGKTQVLNPDEMQLGGGVSLIWAGDLDADKQDDFVIQFGEKPGMILLYLSSEAKGKELVKAVAGYRVTYCC